MRAVLHLLTRPTDSLASDVITLQKSEPELRVSVIDLTKPEPDYAKVLEEVFQSDSVEVW